MLVSLTVTESDSVTVSKDVDKGGLGGLKPPQFFCMHALIMADLLEVSTCTPGSVLYVE